MVVLETKMFIVTKYHGHYLPIVLSFQCGKRRYRGIKRIWSCYKQAVPDPIQSGGKCMTIFFENLPIYSYMTQYHFRTSENSTLVKVTSKSQQRYLTTEWGDRNTSDRVSYFANIRNIGSSF